MPRAPVQLAFSFPPERCDWCGRFRSADLRKAHVCVARADTRTVRLCPVCRAKTTTKDGICLHHLTADLSDLSGSSWGAWATS